VRVIFFFTAMIYTWVCGVCNSKECV